MMLAVWSHAKAQLIQLARCKFKASWVKFVGIRPTQIYYQLKKIFEYVKDLYGPKTIGEHNPAERENKVYENFIKFPRMLTAAGI